MVHSFPFRNIIFLSIHKKFHQPNMYVGVSYIKCIGENIQKLYFHIMSRYTYMYLVSQVFYRNFVKYIYLKYFTLFYLTNLTIFIWFHFVFHFKKKFLIIKDYRQIAISQKGNKLLIFTIGDKRIIKTYDIFLVQNKQKCMRAKKREISNNIIRM